MQGSGLGPRLVPKRLLAKNEKPEILKDWNIIYEGVEWQSVMSKEESEVLVHILLSIKLKRARVFQHKYVWDTVVLYCYEINQKELLLTFLEIETSTKNTVPYSVFWLFYFTLFFDLKKTFRNDFLMLRM